MERHRLNVFKSKQGSYLNKCNSVVLLEKQGHHRKFQIVSTIYFLLVIEINSLLFYIILNRFGGSFHPLSGGGCLHRLKEIYCGTMGKSFALVSVYVSFTNRVGICNTQGFFATTKSYPKHTFCFSEILKSNCFLFLASFSILEQIWGSFSHSIGVCPSY